MDGTRFDDLARSLVSRSSRRRIIAGLAAGLVTIAGRHQADARTCSADGTVCREHANCCSGTCGTGRRGRKTCASVITCGNGGPCTVFVSNSGYTGNLGGIAGADAICASDAQSAGLSGTFLAWISDNTTSPAQRFVRSTGPYLDINATLIANNWDDLTDGSLVNSIRLAANGTDASVSGDYEVWTNTYPDGTPIGTDPDAHCSNWTVGNEYGDGYVGETGNTNSDWTDDEHEDECDYTWRLYCFQQSS